MKQSLCYSVYAAIVAFIGTMPATIKVTWLLALTLRHQPISRRTTKKRKFLKFVIFNGRIAERQDKLCFIVEESRLVWPSCCGLCWAVFWGTLGCVIVVRGHIFSEFRELLSGLTSEDGHMLCFLEQLVLMQEFARRRLNWSFVPTFQAIYCSPGARPSVCRLRSWWLAVDYVVQFNDRQVRRHHRLVSCTSEAGRRAASSGSSEELRHLRSSSVVRYL